MSNKEMNNFESTINSIRNILRVEGITGLESINHCVALIVSRYLTIEKCMEFKIPLEFAFENFLKNKDGSNCDDQTAIGKFYNEDEYKDCLVVHLRDKLQFTTFTFKISAPLNFLNIYKKLADISMDSLFDNIDIVGAIYEQHLKTGTTGSGMRDLGQYFTNREVIKYMIKLCEPKLKENGDIESILDPSMGTGGFLSMSIKYLNEKYKDKINWNLNKDRIYGFDVDETVKNMSILNALLECGKIFNKTFVKNDTLHKDYKISDTVLIDKVDIILANEPFGLKNIIHKNVCQRIRDLKIEGTKAEPLFLQLMMQSLNVKGRCAVIVPDGVLFNDAKLHKLTRKYLCDNLRLAKVISLEDGLFINTGVKSSILFFVNDGETVEVEFCKIKMSNGEIVEESVIKVNIEEIAQNDYSLFVNKYNIVEEEKIDGLEYKTLGDLIINSNSGEVISKDFWNKGNQILYTCGQEWVYSDFNNFPKNKLTSDGDLLLSRNGTPYIKYPISNSMYTNVVQRIKVNTSIVLPKYILYYVNCNKHKLTNIVRIGTIPSYNFEIWKSIKIPIPSIFLQKQIIETLDSIYDTIEGNNKLIENYEKIKKGVIWSNTLNVDKKVITELCDIKCGAKMNLQEYLVDKSNYKIIRTRNINYNDDFLFINKNGYNLCKNCLLKNGDIIMTSFVDNFDCQIVDNNYENSTFNGGIFRLNNFKISNKYIINYLKTDNFRKELENMSIGSTVKMFNVSNLSNINIPIPSKQTQEYIVKECEYYDNLIDTLKKENERLQNNNIIDMVLKSVSNNFNTNEHEENTNQNIINNSDEIQEEEQEEVIEEVKPKKTKSKKTSATN